MQLNPSNVDVAERLEVSPAAVCRFRKGSRVPRVNIRLKIAEEYRWTVQAQAVAHANGTWAREFEAVLQRRHVASSRAA